jgi:AbrB family looped-hinge helix DNA binding protein
MKEHHERMRNHHEGLRKHPERVIVKGYMRPDKTSYYVVIPKEVRELFKLEGGEYFIIRAKPWANEIKLKIAKFVEEQQP